MDDLLSEFLTETAGALNLVDARLVDLEAGSQDVASLNAVLRLVHTIKGTCGFLNLPKLEALTHAGESLLVMLRDRGQAATPDAVRLVLLMTDRIRTMLACLRQTRVECDIDDSELIASLESFSPDTNSPPLVLRGTWSEGSVSGLDTGDDCSDQVFDHVGSRLKRTQARMLDLLQDLSPSSASDSLKRLADAAKRLESDVMVSQCIPVEQMWRRLPPMVEDIARALKKPISLTMEGGDTQIDLHAVEPVRNAIAQSVRNACDHGIELPSVRRSCGKPEAGTLTLRAGRDGPLLSVEIEDDGAGLDVAHIKWSALETGKITPTDAARMTDEEVRDLIFRPGVSTAQTVTTLSGRGVGMDVVRAGLAQIGATVSLRSDPGQGVCVTLLVPVNDLSQTGGQTSAETGSPHMRESARSSIS